MADDDHEVPARPASRGPRVVTGDMLKGKARGPRVVTGASVPPPPPDEDPDDEDPGDDDGDPTAETLVGPGASSPSPPAPAYEPMWPAMLPGRTPPTPAPPAPPASDEPAEVSGPTPAGSAPSIPPPVHRSAAPPPPAPPGARSATGGGIPPKPPKPSKPPKPGKAPKAARTPSGGAREPLAAIAFVLAVASLVLLGITAIPALVVAGRAKRGIAGRPGSTGAGLVSVARILAVVGLVAWLVVGGIAVTSLVRPEGVDYAKLKVGDCIDTPEGTEVRRLKVRSCDSPHDAEVFAVITHPAGPGDAFPGANTLLEYAAAACLGQPFTDYIGIPRGQSTLTEFEIVPESEAWAEDRRGLVCAVDNADRSPLTATVKGSAR